jgi:hypothetical protein
MPYDKQVNDITSSCETETTECIQNITDGNNNRSNKHRKNFQFLFI